MSSTDAPTTTEDATESDDVRAGLLATLEAELGDGIVSSHIQPGVGLWVRVTPDAWVAAGAAARELGCRFFDFLSGIDWMPSPFGRYEDDEVATAESLTAKVEAARSAERETGVAGGDTRFQVLAHVIDVREHHDVFLKVDVPDDDLRLPTWTHLYAGANWHERECWEMFGIGFDGHPDLRKLYLPSEFEGYPLRKDFPLLARVVKPWPGTVDVEPMPGVADEEEPDPTSAGAPA